MSLSRPIFTVDELQNLILNPLNRCRIPIQNLTESRARKVLLCHDMAGGYKKDAIIEGSEGTDVYHCQFLHYIDIFCYFSHERVTIPPRQWTESCHRQGVSCLGTFIVEWGPGELEILKLIYGPAYNPLLFSTQCDFCPFYADKLVQVAKYYGFDGYLFNVESKLSSSIHCIILQRFLNYFRTMLHYEIPGSLLIWYDSVIYTGELKWQDQLNSRNEMFFSVCDGIFTNYTWNQHRLRQSGLNGDSKSRKYDIYTGIDIWGRNTFGGGGFNVHKALREITKVDTSVALFAPGWTFEFLGSEAFEENEKRFWIDSRIKLPENEKYNFDQQDIGCLGDFLSPRILCSSFKTDFCKGVGLLYAEKGQIISHIPWNNLSRQSLQPTIIDTFLLTDSDTSLSTDSEQKLIPKIMSDVVDVDSYNGGQCFLLSGPLEHNFGSFLFETAYHGPLSIELIYKSSLNTEIGIIYRENNGFEDCIFIKKEEQNGYWNKGHASLPKPKSTIDRIGIVIANVPKLKLFSGKIKIDTVQLEESKISSFLKIGQFKLSRIADFT